MITYRYGVHKDSSKGNPLIDWRVMVINVLIEYNAPVVFEMIVHVLLMYQDIGYLMVSVVDKRHQIDQQAVQIATMMVLLVAYT